MNFITSEQQARWTIKKKFFCLCPTAWGCLRVTSGFIYRNHKKKWHSKRRKAILIYYWQIVKLPHIYCATQDFLETSPHPRNQPKSPALFWCPTDLNKHTALSGSAHTLPSMCSFSAGRYQKVRQTITTLNQPSGISANGLDGMEMPWAPRDKYCNLTTKPFEIMSSIMNLLVTAG